MEDYKKKYEHALERAKEQSSKYGIDKVILEEVFPELKESEDERVRKEMIDFMSSQLKSLMPPCPSNETLKTWIAWLEKQGEQKVVKFMTKSYTTPNPEFFQWIYDRLVYQHHENPDMDYMRSLKERIEDMQEIVNVKTDSVLVKQNPTWSEEDERYYDSAL